MAIPRSDTPQRVVHPRPPLPAGVPLRSPQHPGRFLEKNFLQPLSLSQTDAARLLGVSRRRLNEIVQGPRGITPDTAIRCAMVFGTDALFWLALQSRWDSFHAWKSLRQSCTLH